MSTYHRLLREHKNVHGTFPAGSVVVLVELKSSGGLHLFKGFDGRRLRTMFAPPHVDPTPLTTLTESDPPLQPGETVICLNPGDQAGLTLGGIYTVAPSKIPSSLKLVTLMDTPRFGYSITRFARLEPIEATKKTEEPTPELPNPSTIPTWGLWS